MRNAIFTLPLALTFSMSVGCISAVRGSGEVLEEERSLEPFRAVSVSGDLDVDIVVGKRQKVLLRFDDNLLDLIQTEVVDDVLEIRPSADIGFYDTTATDVQIEVPALIAYSASGDTRSELLGVRTASFELDLDGASEVAVEGEVNKLSIGASGDSEIHTRNLKALDVELAASGDSDLTIFASRSVRGSVSGAGSVTVYGDPADTDILESGDVLVEYR